MDQITFRLPDDIARRFRAALAMKGETQQAFLERAVMALLGEEMK